MLPKPISLTNMEARAQLPVESNRIAGAVSVKRPFLSVTAKSFSLREDCTPMPCSGSPVCSSHTVPLMVQLPGLYFEGMTWFSTVAAKSSVVLPSVTYMEKRDWKVKSCPSMSSSRPPARCSTRCCPNTFRVASTIACCRLQRRSWLPCLLYTSPSPRDRTRSRMPSSA